MEAELDDKEKDTKKLKDEKKTIQTKVSDLKKKCHNKDQNVLIWKKIIY